MMQFKHGSKKKITITKDSKTNLNLIKHPPMPNPTQILKQRHHSKPQILSRLSPMTRIQCQVRPSWNFDIEQKPKPICRRETSNPLLQRPLRPGFLMQMQNNLLKLRDKLKKNKRKDVNRTIMVDHLKFQSKEIEFICLHYPKASFFVFFLKGINCIY